ncbi:DNA topoisomerase VI subunit A [Nitzschia inconspicua]|uniref:DNA topoisomerase (ATP-hydrolyzing) n=1 Tax=Nitzschia inconspicua TaxID=303405 RepID=A0A9K3KVD0_9STRA|nr:DNA topoisomerase VI subunit A [Nitzschia inconspicua]KAG7350086.1 DNA topoisomerase VI subunit A [Nitzschia inconspicua]
MPNVSLLQLQRQQPSQSQSHQTTKYLPKTSHHYCCNGDSEDGLLVSSSLNVHPFLYNDHTITTTTTPLQQSSNTPPGDLLHNDHHHQNDNERMEDPVVKLLESFIMESFFIPLLTNTNTKNNDSNDNNQTNGNVNVTVSVPNIDKEQRQLSFWNLHQCRNYTSILLVACFCHRLLLARRTATTREVYYYHVTHFFHQRECDTAIWDLTILLGLTSRHSLGVSASPRGWYCGSIILYNTETGQQILNGCELDTHGTPITPTTYGNPNNFGVLSNLTTMQQQQTTTRTSSSSSSPLYSIQSDAICILVVEKEGVYMRLSEDKIFQRIPCILVTGKGFPDVATRQWVHCLQQLLQIPAVGLCDCNPYGVSVLHTYQFEHGTRIERAKQQHQQQPTTISTVEDGHTITPPSSSQLQIQWIGLRPSQVQQLNLPKSAFQQLSRLDKKRLESFLDSDHPFGRQGWDPQQRRIELEAMKQFKVELEALHWLGMDYLSNFVVSIIQAQIQQQQQQQPIRSNEVTKFSII